MDNKKTPLLVLMFAILCGAAYFVYTKYFPGILPDSISNGSELTNTSENEETVTIDPLELALSNLTEDDKIDAYNIASRIYEDCKGLNSHNMSMYDYLNKWSGAKFYFFVRNAYPSYDGKSLIQRLSLQNWGVLNKWSKDHGYVETKAKELINKIIYRVENFKL